MNRTEFLKAIRHQDGKFRIDNAVITTGVQELCGKGVLEAVDQEFRLSLTLAGAIVPPESPTGIVNKEEFWKIRGQIEDEFDFEMRALPDSTSRNLTFGRAERHSLEFSCNRLELIPRGFDCLTTDQKWAMQEAR